jgi:hypothetical protein
MSAPASRRRRAVLLTLLLGVVVMVAFDAWFTLLLGVLLMLGSIVAGVLLVADPAGFLDHDRDAAETPDGDAPADGG